MEMSPDNTQTTRTEQSGSQDLRIIPCAEYETSPQDMAQASNVALLRALHSAGVQFVRYVTVDCSNTLRCKVAPMKRLMADSKKGKPFPFSNVTSLVDLCTSGLPSYGDVMLPGCTMDARGVLAIQPDLSTLRVLPYAKKTAMVLGTFYNQRNHQLSNLCPRGLLSRVLSTARKDFGLAFSVGAELEFVLVKDEADLPDGQLPKPTDFSVFATTNILNDQDVFISDLYEKLEQQDIEIELIHAESAPGQLEVVLTYQEDPLKLGDDLVFARETIRSVARAHGLRALFLPKINAMQAGNGLHLHFSFRDLASSSMNANAFPDPEKVGEMSPKAKSFLEGILDHLPALLALTVPSVNSFRRVGKGCWTGHAVCWNTEDKEVPLRVCLDLETGEATNVEIKLSDSMANIYLEIAAVVLAGLDGIKQNLNLRPPSDGASEILLPFPTTLLEALEALKEDSFLKTGLGEDLIQNYVVVRTAEAAVSTSLEQEVMDAYRKA